MTESWIDVITIGNETYHIGTDHLGSVDLAAPGLPELADLELTAQEAIDQDQNHEVYTLGDGDAIYRWYIGGDRWLDVERVDGEITNAYVTSSTIESIIVGTWDHECPDAEWLTEWGLTPTITDAPEDYSGPCRVWVDVSYYEGTWDAPVGHYLRRCETDGSTDSDILEFDSRADAQAMIDSLHPERGEDGRPQLVPLSHGQYASDSYTIVAAD